MSVPARRAWLRAAAASLLCATAVPCVAQDATSIRRPARLEVAVLGTAASGAQLDASTASGIGNAVPTGGSSTFFETDSRLSSSLGGEVRVAVRIAGPWWIETGVAYAQPTLEVRLDADVEQATPLTATSRLTQVVADGGVVRRWGRGRLVPFVSASAGYLRQLDDPRTTVGTGQVYSGGGGVLIGLGGRRATPPRVRLRADLRVVSYRGGLALVEERGVGVTGAIGVAVRLR